MLKNPQPAMFRTLYKDPERYVATYWSKYPGKYLAGDAARRDKDGYLWIIGRIDDMISINSCVSVDLYGQICAESNGTRQISGTGGQLDYLTGAAMSKGGKAFICMNSTYTGKDGVTKSRIVPTFSGDIVTSPRSQAYYIVTEYGAVNLVGRSTWERAERLIGIAHPDFRDDLVRQAEAMKIWRRTNKI